MVDDVLVIVVQFLDDEQIKKSYEDADEIIDEGGWWFDDGRIVVRRTNSIVEDCGTAVHEFIEYLLEKRIGMCHTFAHEIAKVFEREFVKVAREGCEW